MGRAAYSASDPARAHLPHPSPTHRAARSAVVGLGRRALPPLRRRLRPPPGPGPHHRLRPRHLRAGRPRLRALRRAPRTAARQRIRPPRRPLPPAARRPRPLYRLFPSPYTLLFAQAALLALAVVPLARQATRVLGRRAGHVIAFGYGLSWGIASAVGFDFHEVCLAVPLVSYALEALAHAAVAPRCRLGRTDAPGQGGPRAHARRDRGVRRLAGPAAGSASPPPCWAWWAACSNSKS